MRIGSNADAGRRQAALAIAATLIVVGVAWCGCAAARCRRACSTTTSGRRRSSSIGTASGCTRRGRRAARAASAIDADALPRDARARDARGRRRAVPLASRASIRSRSCARPWRELRRGRVVEGGSTITQQVAKLLLARQPTGRPRARLVGEDPRGRRRAAARASADEERDPRAVSEPRAVRQSDQGAERAAQAYFGRDARRR